MDKKQDHFGVVGRRIQCTKGHVGEIVGLCEVDYREVHSPMGYLCYTVCRTCKEEVLFMRLYRRPPPHSGYMYPVFHPNMQSRYRIEFFQNIF